MFSMSQHHKYSLTELENLIPFERDIFVNMLMAYLQELKDQQKRNDQQ